jgi:GTP-binding protein
MIIKSAEFVISSTDYKKCPAQPLPEYAFIGRSNVGKSSLINMLVSKKGLAKTSSQPGKTQLINHFIINDNWFLVDLPGYGFAKVSKESREKWQLFITEYLLHRENLTCVMVLVDSRLEPQKIDVEFVNKLGTDGVPFVVVFTKADKVSKTKSLSNMEKFKAEMLKTFEELPQFFITSAEESTGKDELLGFINETNKKLKVEKKPEGWGERNQTF